MLLSWWLMEVMTNDKRQYPPKEDGNQQFPWLRVVVSFVFVVGLFTAILFWTLFLLLYSFYSYIVMVYMSL